MVRLPAYVHALMGTVCTIAFSVIKHCFVYFQILMCSSYDSNIENGPFSDEIKRKVEMKFNEIGDRVQNGELEVEEGYALFKEFEDEMVLEYAKLMEAEGPPQFDKNVVNDDKKEPDDPPGEGPILRWQTRVVFAPGGDAWHPKNRKVKLAVTVKELDLSKHQFVRLRELAGKRYNPGKDELTITSERYLRALFCIFCIDSICSNACLIIHFCEIL